MSACEIVVTQNVRFPGQYYDEETGLHYNRFRYYDPSIGRYVSGDPVGRRDGPNLYRYARNEPSHFFDPLGLSVIEFDRSDGTLSVFPDDGNGGRADGPPQQFDASNNVNRADQDTDPFLPEGKGPAPNGTFDVDPIIPTSGGPESRLGDKGFAPIDLRPIDENGDKFIGPARAGVGIHGGRVGECDRAGRCGEDFGTRGCIRTTPDGMDALNADPPARITIKD